MIEPSPARQRLSVIGAGKVGSAIAQLASSAGYDVMLAGRDPATVRAGLPPSEGPGITVTAIPDAASSTDLVLLTVPDPVIGTVCADLCEAGVLRPGTCVAHCSGALGAEILARAREHCGCNIGSAHPLQTFPTASAAARGLTGSVWFCEGDDDAVLALERLVRAVGGEPQRVDPGRKPLYHAAAVFACNYLTALLDGALTAATNAGIDSTTAWRALEPLVQNTISNVGSMGPGAALTGPIARGDVETVTAHLAHLEEVDSDLADLYRALGRWTVRLAQRNPGADVQSLDALRDALGS